MKDFLTWADSVWEDFKNLFLCEVYNANGAAL